MNAVASADVRARRIEAALAARTSANETFFAAECDTIARLCHRMAERFARGGRLLAFGGSPAARSDAHHVAVEFVHPVIVGKRALPALAIVADQGTLVHRAGLLSQPEDVAMGFGDEAAPPLALARERGCLTIGFDCPAEWAFAVPVADAPLRQEVSETAYHVLWELVHVFFEHRGLLEGREARATHDAGASSFLYPFLGEREHDLEAVVADVRGSVLAKAGDVAALREQTLRDNAAVVDEAAATLRHAFDAGGKLLALGNGGSATDAMDLVADLRFPLDRAWKARPALDLTDDPAILTALANDIGTDALFSRQVIAYGAAGDVLVALSTSGNSANVIAALAEARKRGLRTVAFVGYDGGRVASEQLADHVVVTRSQHIPRIQEAQASAYHLMRELVEVA